MKFIFKKLQILFTRRILRLIYDEVECTRPFAQPRLGAKLLIECNFPATLLLGNAEIFKRVEKE
jgi:hypothetical protein